MSFVRHSVFYQSDQARMGWRQDHPEFQLEVGYANLAVGIVALLAAVLDWGPLACGIVLLIYGLYLLCSLLLHMYEALYVRDIRARATKSVINTGIFVVVLLIFAWLALSDCPGNPFLNKTISDWLSSSETHEDGPVSGFVCSRRNSSYIPQIFPMRHRQSFPFRY